MIDLFSELAWLAGWFVRWPAAYFRIFTPTPIEIAIVYGLLLLWLTRPIERAPTGAVYANPGAWMDAPTFLRVTPQRVELRRWRDGSAEGDLLDAVDRQPEEALPHP